MARKNEAIVEELISDVESNREFAKVTHLSIGNKPEIC